MGPGDLAVDAHELIGLCAPRPVYARKQQKDSLLLFKLILGIRTIYSFDCRKGML